MGRGWTPERAARETKIRVDRLRDLEADEYAHFTSPAYARGFVRTYARALGLDEYRILRQLDNKLPEDDHSTFHETGLPYIPEPSGPSRTPSSYTGLYVILGMGGAVLLILGFVLFQAYRAGELRSYFAQDNGDILTNSVSTNAPVAEAPARAMPVETAPPVATSTNQPPRALPVDASALAAPAMTNAPAAPVAVAAPVDTTTNTAAASAVPPRALPVDLSTLNNGDAAAAPASVPVPVAVPATPVVAKADTVPVDTPTPPRAQPVDLSAIGTTDNVPATEPAAPGPVHPAMAVSPAAPVPTTPMEEGDFANPSGKRLVLAASRDSFIRVTVLDDPENQKVVYASTLGSGQSIGFNGRKFSISVEVPSAVNITLDGVNYGPHSDQETPDTFTVESHQP